MAAILMKSYLGFATFSEVPPNIFDLTYSITKTFIIVVCFIQTNPTGVHKSVPYMLLLLVFRIRVIAVDAALRERDTRLKRK